MKYDYVILQKFSHRKNVIMYVKNYFRTFGRFVWLGTFKESLAYKFDSLKEAEYISKIIDGDEFGSVITEIGA